MSTFLRLIFLRLFTSVNLFLICFLLNGVGFLIAQTNFIPLERGDHIERKENLTFSPGLKISGNYRFRFSKFHSSAPIYSRSDTNSPEEFSFDQDLRLQLRSIVHRIVSLNLEIATNQEPYYKSDLRESASFRKTEMDSQEANIYARQSFLEINRNPNEETKIGKQVINVGDRKGKVFYGILSGLSQRCKAGTWCYEIGGMKLSSVDGDWLYFVSLDYPFWHEVNLLGNVIDSFRIEIFRIKYTEHDVPLGLNNVPSNRLSSSTISDLESGGFSVGGSCNASLSTFTVNSQCKPIYYNAHEQEFFGLRFQWETPDWLIYADIISNQGNRNYFQYDDRLNQNRIKISGKAAEIELSLKNPGEKYTLIGMMASGDEQINDGSGSGGNYLRNLNGYYEISTGTYQGTLFYFNGGSPFLNSGTGLGHSINNTQMGGFRIDYDISETQITYRFGIYELKRIKPVLNVLGEKSSMIGVELDNTFSMYLAEHAKIDLDLNIFKPGDAFSYSDHVLPTGRKDMIYQFAGRITYDF